MKNGYLSNPWLWIAVLCLSPLLCRAQDVGTAAQMPDANGAKIALQVSADDTYSWKLDGEDQGQITAAMGSKRVMTTAGKHEIVARGADGKVKFDRIFTVAAGRSNTVRIISRAAPPAPTTTAPVKTPSPAPQQQQAPVPGGQTRPAGPIRPWEMTGNPDMFATINPRASKQESDADWLVSMTVGAIGPAQYDAKLQVVMKDVGDSHLNVELPEPQPERSAVSYSTRAQELGKEAVVCYTARPPQSEQSLRLTKFYLIKNGSKAGATLFASFVPARESTLEPASDKPCGGLKATKAAPLSTETEAAAPAERKAKRMAVGAPDMFVHITAGAGDPSARYRRFPATTRKPTTSGWQVSVGAVPIHGTHYDVKVQVVMKDIGAGHSSVELADLKPYRLPNLYMASTEALGKQAIVCYTARPADSQQAERWTGTYNIEAGYQEGTATFVAAHEPTLEVASDAPCGGAAVTKAAAPPPAAEESGPREEAVSSPSSRLALSRSRLALSQGSRLYNAKRYAESRPLLIQACDEGASADACNSVGFMYQNHLGVATDYAKAREYYLKACNDESSLSCSNLGTMYRDGLGVPRDNHQAAVLFEKACDAGVPTGCDFGGKMYMEGSGVQVDGPRALDLFKRACEAELAAGCGDEGNIYARGIGVPRDMPFAVSLFRKACDMGSPNGCYSCGSIYRAGDGVPRDPLKAREYFNKACSLGQQQSCTLAMQ